MNRKKKTQRKSIDKWCNNHPEKIKGVYISSAIQRLSIEIVELFDVCFYHVVMSVLRFEQRKTKRIPSFCSCSACHIQRYRPVRNWLIHWHAIQSKYIFITHIYIHSHIYSFGWLTNTLALFDSNITILSVVFSLIIPLCRCLLACSLREHVMSAHIDTQKRIHSNVQSNRRKRRTEESKRR